LQARVAQPTSKIVKNALHTRTTCSTNARPENRPSTEYAPSFPVEELLPQRSGSTVAVFDIGSVELVREFMEHVVAKNTSPALGDGRSTRYAIDWGAVEASVAGSHTLEQAIGRAIVVADQVSRSVFDAIESVGSPSSMHADDPFFAFSLADVVPDFGDESRYRTRVARRMSRIFGAGRTAEPDAGDVLGRHLPGNAVLNS
jgi:hypothetical protein